ncbi:mevalonate kinase [Candidatus Bathyarchaeota archaeon]|nr:mevalonate kinase [Candidatus Bathyarchaeota archaeon]
MGVVASAPAKIILFGEHFVVYGEPAIVVAIDRRARAEAELRQDRRLRFQSANLNTSCYFENGVFKVEQGDAKEAKLKFEPVKLAVEKVFAASGKSVGLDITINSAIPVGAGLGSSAAVVASVTAAVSALLGLEFSKQEIFRIAFKAEKIVHGTPSGVAPAIATLGGTLLFQVNTGFKPLEVETDIPLVIGDTGVERSTKIQVEKVRETMDSFPQIADSLRKAAREIVLRAVAALQENALETLGRLMNINHALLYGIGVSDESLEWLTNAARKAGALGAKLTGAGGGGCMVALARPERLENVSEAIMRAGGSPFIAKKTDEGAKVERT